MLCCVLYVRGNTPLLIIQTRRPMLRGLPKSYRLIYYIIELRYNTTLPHTIFYPLG